ncbi:hypothetical protein TNCV_5112041 [Trichonephila clavipes]|nr:hypothetical protein TNCV_5112041 [Trichonephila clavipes]
MIINNYLRNRSFQIRISSTLSRTAYASAGCPQGSLLSPLLYNIFTHDFPTAPTVHICLFADDAAIISQACNPDVGRINLQNYLKRLQRKANLLTIPPTNTDLRMPGLGMCGRFQHKQITSPAKQSPQNHSQLPALYCEEVPPQRRKHSTSE